MKLLIKTTNYNETIKLAKNINNDYPESIIFHCYWNGILTEKHLYSIQSCYYFNVLNNHHKIILWIENNIPNKFNIEILKYAEIKTFSIKDEMDNTFLENKKILFIGGSSNGLSEKANFYRMLLLYNYGGCWFDLDCFFLRSFDPLFKNYGNEICLYQWENQRYPNNAIMISLNAKSNKMKNNIEFIINRKRGWGFQRAELTYDLELDILVLPCSWFDPGWITTDTTGAGSFITFFENSNKKYNFNNFFPGSFCYHWHNKWNKQIHDKSIIKQLIDIIQNKLYNK
tara:strand:+ start:1080 stop:1934 length:855 start_codon:yes stop_codon:yes gene_type:complete